MAHHDDSDHHAGLAGDLRLLTRRRLLGMAARATAGLGLVPMLAACGADGGDGDGACSAFPEETAGPFPGDGTNGANALALAGIVRSDIRASVGGASGVADGVVLTVTLTVVDSGACTPLAGHAVYVWHCDRDGNYSMYSPAVVNENYLRGVQVTDAAGQVTFTTTFPGCYPGRWPHIHFEVYATLASATSGANMIACSQLALTEDSCAGAYAVAGYGPSAANLLGLSLASDGVFRDGATRQLAATTGSASAGYAAMLAVAIDA
jgi:protocatechuate 3,4-dioxygenase beta subunit